MNTPTQIQGGDEAHATLRQFLDRFVREADGLTGETVLSTYEIQPSPLDMCEAMEALETLRTETATLHAQIARMKQREGELTGALESAANGLADCAWQFKGHHMPASYDVAKVYERDARAVLASLGDTPAGEGRGK